MRNKHLTPGMERALKDLRAMGDDAEIACEGLECWIDLRRTTWRVVNALLKLCLLKDDGFGKGCTGFQRFVPNCESYRLLDDPNYEPIIIEAMRTGKPVIR